MSSMQQNYVTHSLQDSLADIYKFITEQLKHQSEQLQGIYLSKENAKKQMQEQLNKLNESTQRLSKQQTVLQIDPIQILKNQQFQYEIKMAQNLELPCYRNRIFQIKLCIVQNDRVVANINNVQVELQIWTYDKHPKKLTHNNRNQSIYKGCQQATIRKGKGCLNRVQIKEVSSHFPKGMFMLVVMPVDDGGVVGDENKCEIKKEWIKPLIINEVSIKAKKFSDRHNPYFARSDGTISIEQN